ncbi:aminotransferase class I/II-fold pyridoxal phosphate-dependent enzyme [Lactobacillus kefiranofaciens]|uniref:Aminotransferase n=1 Tax=Lactobacillus kefiranofaciens TaxID=267818 RepID=A0ABY0MAU6_9LACO|nr:aminotransferase class I/II-fold pyridoxal phosphate-dependent enzyme [Lactobacillus kefiranofaciens]AEG40424.1 possible aspartate transaminase [Lactobacillus kefiranofaciens subsp. kefiranofaciens]KRL24458.1 aspartate transaminase [Lactobacillus kefiranofaciens subsp. kefirgranum DSM 10550 = JCM 8572]KRM22159.1 aspartate transaminase [Lactobacillus kefiranofaciens subsp. kefiranofaciens DSM 5016 = JCM 6985]MCJ2172134.1 aminotransferase class I/II-fold pyridoxal phosphate-dependent enzyme [L
MPNLSSDLTPIINKRLNNLSASKIRAFDQKVSSIPGIIKLTIGEPDLNTPDHIKNAAIRDIQANDSHYAPQAGKPELLDAISNYLERKIGIHYDPTSEICATVGATGALNDVFMALLNPGDKILVPTPVWALYFQLIKLTGAIPIQIDTKKDNFILTPQHLRHVLDGRGKGAKAIILTNPSNPTGRVYPAEILKELAEVIKEYQIYSVTDEIYAELVYDTVKHHSLSEYIPDRNILISGVSKAYAMTGWRLGYIAGPKEIMQSICKINAFLVTAVTDNVQMAAVEALNNGHDDPKEAKKIYELRLQFMKTGLEKVGFEMATPQGAFYIFAKIPEQYGTDDEQFAFELAQKAQVGVTPGRYFGKGGEGYVRLSYASSNEQMQEALKRIINFVKNL